MKAARRGGRFPPFLKVRVTHPHRGRCGNARTRPRRMGTRPRRMSIRLLRAPHSGHRALQSLSLGIKFHHTPHPSPRFRRRPRRIHSSHRIPQLHCSPSQAAPRKACMGRFRPAPSRIDPNLRLVTPPSRPQSLSHTSGALNPRFKTNRRRSYRRPSPPLTPQNLPRTRLRRKMRSTEAVILTLLPPAARPSLRPSRSPFSALPRRLLPRRVCRARARTMEATRARTDARRRPAARRRRAAQSTRRRQRGGRSSS